MKTYYYNLDGKKGYYTSSQIANGLKVDPILLEELLFLYHDDIDIASINCVKEVNAKEQLANLLQIYPTKYLYSKSLNEIINNQLDIKNNKRKFLNSLKYITNQDDKVCVSFNKKDFCTLLVNTEDDINKQLMGTEEVNNFKAIKELFDSSSTGYMKITVDNKDEIYVDNINGNYPVNVLDTNDDSPKEYTEAVLNISVKDLKVVIEYLSTHKLPIYYNTDITDELIVKPKDEKKLNIIYSTNTIKDNN
ncbi:MAG: hypothetical protein Q4E69_02280 [Bacilli bacterium]|nr:hypothetical protein [Bacilli bacterium]